MQDQIKGKGPHHTLDILLFGVSAFFIALNGLTVALYCLGFKFDLVFFGFIVLSVTPYFCYAKTISDRRARGNEISFATNDQVADEIDRPGFFSRWITRVITSEVEFDRLKNIGYALGQVLFIAGGVLSIWMGTLLFFWWACILAWLISYPVIRGYVYRQLHKAKILTE